MSHFSYIVSDEWNQQRLDLFLSTQKELGLSRTVIQGDIRSGHVMINQVVCTSPKMLVLRGQTVVFEKEDNEKVEKELLIESFNYPILYEDDFLMVINKPANCVVHPAPGHENGTLANALMSYLPEWKNHVAENKISDSDASEHDFDERRPGIVHRLDKDTSGCLLIAKNLEIQKHLIALFASRQIQKTYLALTLRLPKNNEGMIQTTLGRHPVNRQKMAVNVANGREALTEYQKIGEGCWNKNSVGLLQLQLHTGRTHQIRVHLAFLGCPVLGDSVYGGKQPDGVERQMLHARKLSFVHPKTQKKLEILAPLPEDFKQMMGQIIWTNEGEYERFYKIIQSDD